MSHDSDGAFACDPTDKTVVWSNSAVFDRAEETRRTVVSPIVTCDSVVTQTDRETVCLSLESGERLWKRDWGAVGRGRDLCPYDDLVIVPDGETVTALRLEDGSESWSVNIDEVFDHDTGLVNGLAADDERVYVTTGDVSENGGVFALEAGTGDLEWRQPETPSLSQPSVGDDALLVRTVGGSIEAYEHRSGSRRFSIPGDAPTPRRFYPFCVDEDREQFYVVDEYDQRISARSLSDGERRWRTGLDDRPRVPPVLADETLLIGADGLALIDPGSGDVVDRLEADVRSRLAVGADGVYVGTSNGTVLVE